MDRSQDVVLVAAAPEFDAARVQHLLAMDMVVVLAPSPESLRQWLTLLLEAAPADGDGGALDRVQLGRLEIDGEGHEARWDGRRLPLTEQELQLLATFVGRPAHAWSFEELAGRIWGYRASDGWEVRSAVKRLRRKLAEAGVKGSIEAVRGVGFRWAPERAGGGGEDGDGASGDPRDGRLVRSWGGDPRAGDARDPASDGG